MDISRKNIFCALSVSLALAIMLGALGAHKLKDLLSPIYLNAWKTAAEYHLTQTLGLFAMVLTGHIMSVQKIKLPVYLLASGIILFSGSLYILSLNEIFGESLKIVGPITPIGGVLMIAGWIVFAIKIFKQK
ncbi:MAG: DUF423 domain-containing protein [Bacteroidia bacterium]|nr:DUF423 domain-containing protein [Bacteroidia bacterium]